MICCRLPVALFAGVIFLTMLARPHMAAASAAEDCMPLRPSPASLSAELFMPEPHKVNDLVPSAVVRGSALASFDQWVQANQAEPVWSRADTRLSTFAGLGMESRIDIETNVRPLDQYKTGYCTFVTALNVDVLALSYMSIPVSSPLEECGGETLLEHEYKHYQVNRYVLEQAVAKLRRDLPRIIREEQFERIVPAAETHSFEESVKLRLKDIVANYLAQEVVEKLPPLNQQTDSADEYNRVRKLTMLCDIKDALANGNKERAAQLMQKFKESFPDIATPPAAAP